MKIRHWLLSFIVAAGALAPVLAHADPRISVDIAIGPPPAPVYVAPPPPPFPAAVWAPGYWVWNGYRHVWVDGRYLAPRPGYVWVPDRWVPRGPRWHHSRGYWAREPHGRGHYRGHRH